MLKVDINLELENWYDDKSFALFKNDSNFKPINLIL